jgi:hypothetical protein
MPTRAAVNKPKASKVFTAEEKSAMMDRAKEVKGGGKEQGEGVVLAKLAEMGDADRTLGKRIHSIVMGAAPSLTPTLWYGMPAYSKNGKIVCHFQPAQKFKTRYASVGFSDKANLDDGTLWPVMYAVTKLSAADEAKLSALVKKAVS